MTTLGKCLVFHLKYWTEMEKLFWTEGTLEGLEDVEKTLEMVRAVGDESMREAANFLETCGEPVEAYFKKIVRCQRLTSRNAIEKKWSISFNVWMTARPGTPRLLAGVSIPQNQRAEVLVWLCCKGKSAAEEKMAQFLQPSKVKARSADVGLPSGTIVLERIPIFASDDGSEIDGALIVEKVRAAFSSITKADCEYLYKVPTMV